MIRGAEGRRGRKQGIVGCPTPPHGPHRPKISCARAYRCNGLRLKSECVGSTSFVDDKEFYEAIA
jgi:hypothetical protein